MAKMVAGFPHYCASDPVVSRGWLTDARSIPMSIANIFCTTLSSMKLVTRLIPLSQVGQYVV